ncbi:YhhN family protein [Allomuricauda ruestringensis DSM 13258]|uniref:YhhN family protein n=1 Tax=Allomuricauda ruestringensis (strain DSM 13258 / CIP 107369 / LMG 19739 / B1) TaxID=886377 RepID=G2PNB8_ALLRU|nr:lysoplasmalogenase [Allomuricauda ruestringensis]AEM70242.1 YhhN family protein [Allomuricauda ruestringensis DSM 13258]
MVAKSLKAAGTINILIVISAVLAIYFGLYDHKQLFMIFKPLTTILVITLPFFTPKKSCVQLGRMVTIALAFCLLGDVLLLFENYFLFGLVAFLVAHILFVVSFIQYKGFYKNWISFLVLFCIGGVLFFWLRPGLGDLLLPVSIYVVIITFMAWQGVGLYLRERNNAHAYITMGVLFFMLSDTLLAIAKFMTPFYLSGPLILATYWLSISLIANATRKIVLKPAIGAHTRKPN